MIGLLKRELVGHMGAIDAGDPYVTPISYVHMSDALFLRTGPGRRLDALRDHPRVCVEVSTFSPERGDWESVIVWGDAAVVEGDEADEAVGLLMFKYRDVYESTAAYADPTDLAPGEVVVKIPIELMTGRRSVAGFTPHLRPGRL